MDNLSSISQAPGKSEKSAVNPADIERMMEFEFAQQRAAWQRVSSHRNTFRTMSLLFFFGIIATAFIAYFYFFYDYSICSGKRNFSFTLFLLDATSR